jgi:hypothetical protein
MDALRRITRLGVINHRGDVGHSAGFAPRIDGTFMRKYWANTEVDEAATVDHVDMNLVGTRPTRPGGQP